MPPGIFAVDQPSGARWDLALDLLGHGEPFRLGPVIFRRADSSTIEAAVESEWQLPSLTTARALRDFEEARRWVEELLADDEGFRHAVGDSSIEYFLVDDYEFGSVFLARLVDNRVEWLVRPPSEAED